MDTRYLQDVANMRRDILWNKACVIWTVLKEYPVPNIVLNNRLKTTGGMAWYTPPQYKIDLSTELFWEYTETYISEIIPHEFAHIIDYIINGYRPGLSAPHNELWQAVCIKLRGFTLPRYHRMINSNHEARKAKAL